MSAFVAVIAWEDFPGGNNDDFVAGLCPQRGDIIDIRPYPAFFGNAEHIGAVSPENGQGYPILHLKFTGKTADEVLHYAHEWATYEDVTKPSGAIDRKRILHAYRKFKFDIDANISKEDQDLLKTSADFLLFEFDVSTITEKGV